MVFRNSLGSMENQARAGVHLVQSDNSPIAAVRARSPEKMEAAASCWRRSSHRLLGGYEPSTHARYPFTLIELQMDGKGEGVGKLSIATRITLNGYVLTLENFANQQRTRSILMLARTTC